ncbi:MAG: hypothetical protein VX798_03350 [Bacteroidota bacterium]|uniref:hypothetical protein n=1 Tax=Flagellimonas profundi TaxID=2915620 RepID=UPI0028BE2BD8|nr:hypothetical protein [Allomuricauda profundi]MEC7770190.1 hypothetical protein [Bacteroidota bacterium]
MEHIYKGVNKEVTVLEKAQHSYIKGHTYPKPVSCFFLFIKMLVNFLANKKVDQRAKKYQEQKTPVPPTIKKVARKNYKNVLNLGIVFKNKPIKQKNNRKKY